MKKLTNIRNEKPLYYVCIDGNNEFESESLKECKDYLLKFLKAMKENKIKILDEENFYIGMYNIDIIEF